MDGSESLSCSSLQTANFDQLHCQGSAKVNIIGFLSRVRKDCNDWKTTDLKFWASVRRALLEEGGGSNWRNSCGKGDVEARFVELVRCIGSFARLPALSKRSGSCQRNVKIVLNSKHSVMLTDRRHGKQARCRERADYRRHASQSVGSLRDVVKKGKCNGSQWSRLTANNESTNVPPAARLGWKYVERFAKTAGRTQQAAHRLYLASLDSDPAWPCVSISKRRKRTRSEFQITAITLKVLNLLFKRNVVVMRRYLSLVCIDRGVLHYQQNIFASRTLKGATIAVRFAKHLQNATFG